jgi:DNA-binding transcriptional MerR regulator
MPDNKTGHRPDTVRTVRTAYSLSEASELLGVSPEALRKRIKRGTIKAKKDKSGNWRVFINEADTVRTNGRTASGEVEALKAHIDDLREQLKEANKARQEAEEGRKRSEFMFMLERQKVLELEAPKEKRLSWWQRLFEKQEHKK